MLLTMERMLLYLLTLPYDRGSAVLPLTDEHNTNVFSPCTTVIEMLFFSNHSTCLIQIKILVFFSFLPSHKIESCDRQLLTKYGYFK